MSRVPLGEFLGGYLAEVEEHLTSAAQNLLAVERSLGQGEAHPRAVRELFRSLHTVKGLSAMLDVEPVVELAHLMEAVLRSADRGGGRLPARAPDVLVRGLRAIEERVRALAAGQPVPAAPPELLLALTAVDEATSPSPPPRPLVELPAELANKLDSSQREQLIQAAAHGKRGLRLDFVPTAERAARGQTISSVREKIEALAEIVKVIPLSVPRTPEAPGGLAFALLVLSELADPLLLEATGLEPAALTVLFEPGGPAAEPAAAEPGGAEMLGPLEGQIDDALESAPRGRVIRVEVSRLDDALEHLSALVVTRFRLSRAVAELAERGVDVRALNEVVARSSRQLRDLRASIMRVRMVPVAQMLERVPLIVRSLARSTGKEVHLEIEAGRSEVDKAVGERLFPAIVHLVRNAVDHALEAPEERERLGKPRAGLLRIVCHERSNSQLELSLIDDGRGIDRERVAARAGRSVPSTDGELLDLLVQPGFSTRDQATTTSGRGLGMDIIRRIAVTELGGDLRLQTRPGQGSTFTLRVPLTITIVDVFTFVCGAQSFVVPVSMVEEVIEVERDRVVHPPLGGDGVADVALIQRRGEALPLVELGHWLALGGELHAARKAIVVRRGGQAVAFAVNRLLGKQEVVVRPIDDPLVKVVGVTGSTDLGDGKPTLVLDLVALGGRYQQAAGVAA